MDQHVTYLITAYVHGELPPHLRERVSRHVQQCDACYAALRREQELSDTLQDGLRVTAGPRSDQLAHLLPGIVAASGSTRSGRLSRRSGVGMAVVISMLVILLVPALIMPRVVALSSPQDQPPPQVLVTATRVMTDVPSQVVASPTAVAVRFVPVTDPPELNPSPVPVLDTVPGQ